MNTLPPEWYAENVPVDYPTRARFVHPRLDGKGIHVVIHPAIPWRQVVVMGLTAVFIGFVVAVQL